MTILTDPEVMVVKVASPRVEEGEEPTETPEGEEPAAEAEGEEPTAEAESESSEESSDK